MNCNRVPYVGDDVDYKVYKDLGNSSVTVYRLGNHARVFNMWNISLDNIKTIVLDDIDKPLHVVDSPTFFNADAKMVRIRLSGNAVTGWVVNTYGSGQFVESSSSVLFGQFFYISERP